MTGMITDIFRAVITEPLYNALVGLISAVPFADIGIAVILLTVIVKLILFPLSLKAARTQIVLRAIEPKLKAIKKEHPTDKEAQARAMMHIYKTHRINPLLSIGLLFIQLPIILGLYLVFARTGLPQLDPTLLYAFTPLPDSIGVRFLWVPDLGGRDIALALLSGITQFYQIKLTLPALSPKSGGNSLQEDFTRSLHLNMRYVLPVVVTVFAYLVSAAVALYWVTSNLFAIGQELYVRRRLRPQDLTIENAGPVAS